MWRKCFQYRRLLGKSNKECEKVITKPTFFSGIYVESRAALYCKFQCQLSHLDENNMYSIKHQNIINCSVLQCFFFVYLFFLFVRLQAKQKQIFFPSSSDWQPNLTIHLRFQAVKTSLLLLRIISARRNVTDLSSLGCQLFKRGWKTQTTKKKSRKSRNETTMKLKQQLFLRSQRANDSL